MRNVKDRAFDLRKLANFGEDERDLAVTRYRTDKIADALIK